MAYTDTDADLLEILSQTLTYYVKFVSDTGVVRWGTIKENAIPAFHLRMQRGCRHISSYAVAATLEELGTEAAGELSLPSPPLPPLWMIRPIASQRRLAYPDPHIMWDFIEPASVPVASEPYWVLGAARGKLSFQAERFKSQ